MSEQMSLMSEPSTPPRRAPAGAGRRCRYPECGDHSIVGSGISYCPDHECDIDNCHRKARERGRCKLHAYCAAEGCENRRREASAAKYCEEHATSIDYVIQDRNTNARLTRERSCMVCGVSFAHHSSWVCYEHRHLGTLMKGWRTRYGLTPEQSVALVADARCWICDRDLSWRFHPMSGKQRQVHVDHDHRCCDGEKSCHVAGVRSGCRRRMGVGAMRSWLYRHPTVAFLLCCIAFLYASYKTFDYALFRDGWWRLMAVAWFGIAWRFDDAARKFWRLS